MTRRKNIRRYDDPLRHPDHPRPRTRREFLSQGFIFGSGLVLGSTALTLGSGSARATINVARAADSSSAASATQGAGKIPFICFDLAGGGNTAGSNVLIGKQGGQLDFLTTDGYAKQGLPGDMIPPVDRHDDRAQSRQLGIRARVPFGQRVSARHDDARHRSGGSRADQRRGDSGAIGKRHGQQPAQPDVRHRESGRRRFAAVADRFVELGLGR